MRVEVSRVIVAGVFGLGCAEPPTAVPIAPFDAAMQPSIAASSNVTGTGGNETVRVSVTMTNPDAAARRYTKRIPCFLLLHLYANPSRTGTPAYADEWHVGGCKWFPVADTLAARAAVTFTTTSQPMLFTTSYPSLLHPLPAGRYYASVSVGVLELTPTNEIPVGEVVLATP